MTPADVYNISHLAIWSVLKMSAPIMIAGMSVGLLVALFQAMTQIQEMTLTFVPKIIVIFACLLIFISSMGDTLMGLSDQVFDQIVRLT